jgi:hypothetical protein
MNRTIEKRTKEVEVVTDVFCNKCGKSCKKRPGGFYGLIDAVVTGGYGSNPLEDMTTYVFSLCEDCLHKIFQGFKIPVETHDWVSLDEPPEIPKRKYEYDGMFGEKDEEAAAQKD